MKISKILMSSSLLFSILLMFLYQKNIFINIIINRNLEIFFSGTIAFILIPLKDITIQDVEDWMFELSKTITKIRGWQILIELYLTRISTELEDT